MLLNKNLQLHTYKGEALLSLSKSRVRSEYYTLIKVSHCLIHLVQQDLQLSENTAQYR